MGESTVPFRHVAVLLLRRVGSRKTAFAKARLITAALAPFDANGHRALKVV
jgi:hypothetical protein